MATLHIRGSSQPLCTTHYRCGRYKHAVVAYRSPPSSIVVVLWKALYQSRGGRLPTVPYVRFYSEVRPRERSGRGHFLPLGKKASSYRGAFRVPLLNWSVCLCVCQCVHVKHSSFLLIARAVRGRLSYSWDLWKLASLGYRVGRVSPQDVSRLSRSPGCCEFRGVFWVGRIFVAFFFSSFFSFERTRPAANMRPP